MCKKSNPYGVPLEIRQAKGSGLRGVSREGGWESVGLRIIASCEIRRDAETLRDTLDKIRSHLLLGASVVWVQWRDGESSIAWCENRSTNGSVPNGSSDDGQLRLVPPNFFLEIPLKSRDFPERSPMVRVHRSVVDVHARRKTLAVGHAAGQCEHRCRRGVVFGERQLNSAPSKVQNEMAVADRKSVV